MVMMQKIIIKNFGPVKDCALTLCNFMILIGEQATGKSTICKCIYYFKTIRDEVKSHLHKILDQGSDYSDQFPECLYVELKNKFEDLFGMSTFKKEFVLDYIYNDEISLRIDTTLVEKRNLNFIFSNKLINSIKELEGKAHNQHDILKNMKFSEELYYQLEKNKFFMIMDKEVNQIFGDDRENFYIPAGRGLLSLLTKQLLNIELKNMDYITADFMKLIQRNRDLFDGVWSEVFDKSDILSIVKVKRDNLRTNVKSLLKGEYYYHNEKEYIRLNNKKSLPINFASSGQQEILWIVNLLFLWMIREKKVFVVIEEPEAHLFPRAQKEIVEFISLFVNSHDNNVMITTHSPYILTAANNLLYAGKIGAIKNDLVQKIIPRDKWINPQEFGAFMIGDKGQKYVKSIIDQELKEIAAEEIDDTSNENRNIYAEIFQLEVDDNNAE